MRGRTRRSCLLKELSGLTAERRLSAMTSVRRRRLSLQKAPAPEQHQFTRELVHLGTSDGRARRDQVTRLMVKTTLSTLSDELWTVALATSVYVPVSRAPCAMLRLNSATPFCRLKVRVGPPHRVPPPVFCPSWIVT